MTPLACIGHREARAAQTWRAAAAAGRSAVACRWWASVMSIGGSNGVSIGVSIAVAVALLLGAGPAWARGGTSADPAGAGPWSVRPRAAPDPLAVEDVDVWLSIVRGGQVSAGGTEVPRKGGWVDGVVEYRLDRPARAGESLYLLNFAESMPTEPVELVETALETYIAGPFDPGQLEISGHEGVASIRRVGPTRDVVLYPQPGAQRVILRYTVDVPRRYWPFGCVWQRCALSGAIAPLPSLPAQGGRYLPEGGRVIAPARWTVHRAEFAAVPPPRARPRRPFEVVVVGGDGALTEYPSVFWGRQWYRTTKIRRGVAIEVLHIERRPSAQVPAERFIQLRRDLPGTALKIAEEIVELLALVVEPMPPDSTITFVHGPLRSQLAEFHPGVVLLSDHALEIFPAERFMQFHRMAIARAVLDMTMQRRFRGTHDPSTDTWLPGTVAFALASVWRRARDARDEFAADILRNLTFVPAVDRFLYTQQAAFSQSYFRGVDDHPPLRNHPLWYAHALPTGRRIHEKLADTIGPAALDDFYQRVAKHPRGDPRHHAEQAWGHTLDWFFEQWLGPYPSVDYLLHKVQSAPTPGGGWDHTIVVERIGEGPVIEPVQVLVTERRRRGHAPGTGGTAKQRRAEARAAEQHYLTWNGQVSAEAESLAQEPARGRHTWRLHTDGKLKSVRLDPRVRLVQRPQPPHDNVDPRFNDRQPRKFRFLYTGAGFSLAASEFITAKTIGARFNALSGFASFEGSLRRDLRATGSTNIFRDRESVIGGGIGANAWFGRKVNNQRRRARVRTGMTGALLNPGSLDPRGGLRLIEWVSLIDDTRRFGWWPERGRMISATVSTRQTLRADGAGTDDRLDLAMGAGWVHLWRLAHDHVLASALRVDVVVPLQGEPEFRGLLRAGGIGGLSGYSANEIFGRGLALGQLEYRHVYVRDLPINVLHLGYLRALAGTVSAGVASVAGCDSLSGWFGKDSYYTHVGYALGAYMSILGVSPQLIKVDLSVPLVRRQGVQCLGHTLPDYLAEVQGLTDPAPLLPPFNVNLSFGQNF